MNKALVVILFSVVLDAVGAGLIIPILPSLLRDLTGLGEISTLYGVILAVYGAMAFAFAPMLGALSDRYGRRPILLLAMAGAALDYLVLAFAPNLAVLVIGRMVAGMTAASMAVATAYIADISTAKERAGRFGLLFASFGVGFIIGPMAGGVLGEFWIKAPFLVAAVLNMFNFAMAAFLLPETHKGHARRLTLKEINPFQPLKWAMAFAEIRPLLIVITIMGFIGAVYVSVWVLFGADRFGWGMGMIGLSLAAYGVFQSFSQAVLTGPVSRWLGERNTVLLGLGFEIFALGVLALASQGWIVFALLPLFALGGLGEPALQSLLSVRAGPEHQGKLQGVLSSLVTLASVFGMLVFPVIYGFLKPVSPGLIWVVALMLYVAVIPLVIFGGKAWHRPGGE